MGTPPRRTRGSRRWQPLLAIALGLLATVALGRLYTATRRWLSEAVTPLAVRTANSPRESRAGGSAAGYNPTLESRSHMSGGPASRQREG